MRINPIITNLNDGAPGATMLKGPGAADSASFADQLKMKISEVNQLQKDADKAMTDSTVKGATNIHETMIRMEEADMGLRLMTKLRNKALDAYHEVMRMQF